MSVCPSILGHLQTPGPGVQEARQSRATYITLVGEAKPSKILKNSLQCFITSQLSFAEVVYFRTPTYLGCTRKACTSQCNEF